MRDERIDALESKVDEYEQRDRNIIITGLQNRQANSEGVRKFLNKNIGTNLNVFDREYTLKLKTMRDEAPVRVMVVFTEKKNKTLVMKNKKRLKGKDRIHVWITDDLTLY